LFSSSLAMSLGTVEACADRAVFWAELGLVSAPAVLARLGLALQRVASQDSELWEALSVAATHVQRDCLVVSKLACLSTGAEAFRTSDVQLKQDSEGNCGYRGHVAPHHIKRAFTETHQFRPRSVSVVGAPSARSCGSYPSFARSLVDHDFESSQASGRTSESSEVSDTEVSSLTTLLPGLSPLSGLLPFLAAPPSQTSCRRICGAILLALVVAGGCMQAAVALIGRGDIPESYNARGFASTVFRVDYLSSAAHAFACIPICLGMSNVVRSDEFCAVSRMGCDSSGGLAARECFTQKLFVLVAVMTFGSLVWTVFWSFALTKYPCALLGNYQRLVNLLTWGSYIFCTGAFTLAFGLLWRMTYDAIDKAVSREYRKVCWPMVQLWRSGSFGMSVLTVLTVKVLHVAWCVLLGLQEKDFLWWLFHYISASLDAVYIMTVLYLMAKLKCLCQSPKGTDASVLVLASKHFGSVHAKELASYDHFIQTVRFTPCGVELWPIGTITMNKTFLAIRVFAAIIPACFAWGMHATEASQRGSL